MGEETVLNTELNILLCFGGWGSGWETREGSGNVIHMPEILIKTNRTGFPRARAAERPAPVRRNGVGHGGRGVFALLGPSDLRLRARGRGATDNRSYSWTRMN